MGKRMTVGSSLRTPVKHRLMRGFIGEEVGVAGSIRAVDRHIWLDLTAGDATPAYDAPWRESCSPGILAYHASRARKAVRIGLYEVNTAAYGALLRRLGAELPQLGYASRDDAWWQIGDRVTLRAFNSDGRKAPVSYIRRSDAVIVLNDPNAITEWAMRPTFASEITGLTSWFRSLSTLGCNVCGIKRGPLDRPGTLPFGDAGLMSPAERAGWFELVGSLERETPPARDLLLAAIEHDASQWAYLISTATAGSWRPKTEARVRSAFSGANLTADMAWMREDRENFERIKRTLFLTRRELHEAANTPLPFDGLSGEAV